jgi:S-(hydroxymethyl)glutathione dehydrogenase/alcohol dehydrogenase
MPLEMAALVGCGVITGIGAVVNAAQVRPGASVAVFGTGGVGLNVIQGAALVGAEKIIAVDLLDNKLEYAREMGATHGVNSPVDRGWTMPSR